MIIKNTDGSYCKIKDIKISGLKAYITLVIYSAVPQTTKDSLGNIHRVFSFYIKDLKTKETFLVSSNKYWIDRLNNYDSDSNNIDINMYKEIILEIDITNNNTSEMIGTQWIRCCKLLLKDLTTPDKTEAWESEELTLISKEISLPELSNLVTKVSKDHKISISFNYTYNIQEDFNYTNTNLITVIQIRNTTINTVLEEIVLPHTTGDKAASFIDSYNKVGAISCNTENSYTEPVTIQIYLKNLHGYVLKTYTITINPSIITTPISLLSNGVTHINSLYIKTATGIKPISTVKIK